MKRNLCFGLVVCALFVLVAGEANATTTTITCNDNSGDTAALQALLTAATKGETIEITGFCYGDYFLDTSGVAIANDSGSTTLSTTDGIDGMLEITSAKVIITGITMKSVGYVLTPTRLSTAAGSSQYEAGVLFMHEGAIVVVQDSQIGPSLGTGAFVVHSSNLTMLNSTVSGNGQGGASPYTGAFTNGIFLQANASLRLGYPNGLLPDTVQGNGTVVGGTCYGYDISVNQSSSADLYSATVGGTTSSTGYQCGEIYSLGGSSVRARSLTLRHYGGFGPAIQALGSSAIQLDKEAALTTVTTVADGSGNATGAVLAGGGSSVIIQGSTITAPTTSAQPATLEAGAASTIILAGTNNITNSGGGLVLQVDHSSSLMEQSGTRFSDAIGTDLLSGDGLVQEQSSMDLGLGLVSSSPSISWTTGSNGISVQQNSSFRVSGGVSITGAVTITQGSNGFANTANGGTNAITSASCPFTNVPSSHWASPAKVTPAVPSATSYGTATSPQCLAF